jgi:hypothetical protein
MDTYTKEEVLELLKKQREICYLSAKIVEHEYVNPYSESDGEITRCIDRDSIIDAEIPVL